MNTYAPLPSTLHVGQRVIQPKYAEDEILEVLKVYDDGRVLLCHENGVRAYPPIEIQTLQNYDYELITKE